MSDYLLFVDTETSGWPKDWHQPYSAEGNWPYVVQVAWTIYTSDGEAVKTENHFISNDDFSISPTSQQIHGITREFLLREGLGRETVFQILADDLQQYQPLVIGYFTQLDYHMISAEFYRSGIKSCLAELPIFCVMKAVSAYAYFPQKKYLSLDRLYEKLFHKPLLKHHNALADTQATAQCFFELQAQGRINEQVIARQQPFERVMKPRKRSSKEFQALLALALLILLAIFYLFLN